MKQALRLGPILLVLACAAPADRKPGTEEGPPPARGLVIAEYEGTFREEPPISQAVKRLPKALDEAREILRRRLGLPLDPDRRRVLRLTDHGSRVETNTRLRSGRRVQEISLPAAVLMRGEATLDELTLTALCRAALSDRPSGRLPAWFSRGAPLYVSGRWDRILHSRILGGPAIVRDLDRLVPLFEPDAPTADPLSGALFLRFLAEEFGADRVAKLAGAFFAARRPSEALEAVLGTDPASLPVAFDGFRRRAVGDLLEDPFLERLAAARSRPPADRVVAVTGLARRCRDPYVAAAMREELGLALFEAGDHGAAAATLAAVERESPRYALHLDRDRLLFALTFARRGESEGAALRLSAFLDEFPDSIYAPQGLFELAGVLLGLNRTVDAMKRYRELAARFPKHAETRKALLVLEAWERTRQRFGLARDYLTRLLPDPEARRRLATLDEEEARGLSPTSKKAVRKAIRELASPSAEEGREAIRVLDAFGPVTLPQLIEAYHDYPRNPPLPDFRLRTARLLGRWPAARARPLLTRLLADPDPAVASTVVDVLAAQGMSLGEIREAIRHLPGDGHVAAGIVDRRLLPSVPAPVSALLQSPDYRQRLRGVRRLLGTPGPVPGSVLARLAGDPSPQVRRVVAGLLAARSDPAATEILVKTLGDPSPLVRATAAGSLGDLGRLDPLRRLALADSDGRVRTAAAVALLAKGKEEDLPRILALLEDHDGLVRNSVERLLRESPRRDLGPALAAALRAAGSPAPAMRLVRVIAARAGTDFGYDPSGGAGSRRRTADAFEAWWRKERASK